MELEQVSHRELRNDSAAVLRRVAAGETLMVTNRGKPAAVIGPVPTDALARLEAEGQLRPARTDPASLRSIERKRSSMASEDLVADVRGRW